MRPELLPLAAVPLLVAIGASGPTHHTRAIDTAAPAAAIIPPHAGARAPSFHMRSLDRANSLCGIKPPQPVKPDSQPQQQQKPEDWGPKPQPPASVEQLIAQGKLKDAAKELDSWARYEIRARENTASEKANRGDGPEGPKPDFREMLYIEKLVKDQYAARLGIDGEYNALPAVTRIAARWADVRIPKLYTDGKAKAQQGGPTYPTEVAEIIDIGKQVALLGGQPKNGRASGSIETAGEVFDIWANIRNKQLKEEGLQEAEKAEREPPPQPGEILGNSKQVALLGLPGGRYTAESEAMDIAKQILGKWADLRVRKLETEGTEKAKRGEPAPPEQEILDLIDVIARLGSWKNDVRGRGPEALYVVKNIAFEWTRARLEPMKRDGNAAATGQETTPPQVDQIVQFASDNNCLGLEETSFRTDTENAARAIGELNFQLYRDRLSCPVAEEKKAVVGRLAGDLEKHGWGPYDRSFGCGWSGTITITQQFAEEYEEDINIGAGPEHKHVAWSDTMRILFTVADGAANSTVTGERRFVDTVTSNSCGTKVFMNESRYSGSGSTTVEVKDVSGRQLISFRAPAYNEKKTGRFKGPSPFCESPVKTIENQPQELSTRETTEYIYADAAPLMGLDGKPMGTTLEGREVTEIPGPKTGPIKRITEWKLVRRR